MKKILIPIVSLALLFSVSCSDDDSSREPRENPGETVLTDLSGNLTSDRTLTAGEYTLTTTLFVKSGATLTIEPGVTIKATAGGTDAFIIVERGAKIMAEGTASQPIRFTSSADNQRSGDWGGLIINGRAPISRQAGAPNEAATEVRNDVLFGGDDATDNSGVLNYVILEYTGARIGDDAEHNGLTLNGVGSGTKISNIAIFNGDDDAIEWFGGSVDVTNLLVVNARDDMFDVSQGWTGTLKNAYGIRQSNFNVVTSDPRGIESDGNLDGKSPSDIGQSSFTVENVTIVNQNDGIALNDAIKVRRGATANIINALVIDPDNGVFLGTDKDGDDIKSGFSDFVDFEDGRGNANPASTVNVSGTGISETDIKLGDATEAAVTVPATANTGADTSVFGWTNFTFPTF